MWRTEQVEAMHWKDKHATMSQALYHALDTSAASLNSLILTGQPYRSTGIFKLQCQWEEAAPPSQSQVPISIPVPLISPRADTNTCSSKMQSVTDG